MFSLHLASIGRRPARLRVGWDFEDANQLAQAVFGETVRLFDCGVVTDAISSGITSRQLISVTFSFCLGRHSLKLNSSTWS